MWSTSGFCSLGSECSIMKEKQQAEVQQTTSHCDWNTLANVEFSCEVKASFNHRNILLLKSKKKTHSHFTATISADVQRNIFDNVWATKTNKVSPHELSAEVKLRFSQLKFIFTRLLLIQTGFVFVKSNNRNLVKLLPFRLETKQMKSSRPKFMLRLVLTFL